MKVGRCPAPAMVAHHALAFRLCTDHVELHRRVADTVLDAAMLVSRKTSFQAGRELTRSVGEALERARRRFARQVSRR